jgi:hypothetical protein
MTAGILPAAREVKNCSFIKNKFFIRKTTWNVIKKQDYLPLLNQKVKRKVQRCFRSF